MRFLVKKSQKKISGYFLTIQTYELRSVSYPKAGLIPFFQDCNTNFQKLNDLIKGSLKKVKLV